MLSLLSSSILYHGAGTIVALVETPCGLTNANLSMIQLPHFKNLYKQCQVYRVSPSPNKGFISLYTFKLHGFLLYYSVLPLVGGPFSLPSLRSASDDSTYLYHRIMRAFNFTLLAVLSYVAVIGATPLGARAPDEAIDRRQLPLYVV
ncbi:hypothetical protein F5888DRAFT_264353 [Russula emetica]|nr:hypothetical protein F5888DRAFT_264353 [Russula emetica]